MATDSFTASDGTQLTAYNADWLLGNAIASDWVMQSNAVRTPFDRVALSAYYTGSFANDQYAEAKVAQTGSASQYLGVAVRCSGGNFYGFAVDGARYVVWKHLSPGGYTELAFATRAIGVGDVIRLEASGTTLIAKHNGATVVTVTDASLSTGSPGLGALPAATSGTYTLLDDWVGDDLSAAALQFYQYDWPHQLHARR